MLRLEADKLFTTTLKTIAENEDDGSGHGVLP
jgi:hypothetical protein